jgi:hypothetical protein
VADLAGLAQERKRGNGGDFLASLRDALFSRRRVPVVVRPFLPRTTTGYHLPTLRVERYVRDTKRSLVGAAWLRRPGHHQIQVVGDRLYKHRILFASGERSTDSILWVRALVQGYSGSAHWCSGRRIGATVCNSDARSPSLRSLAIQRLKCADQYWRGRQAEARYWRAPK